MKVLTPFRFLCCATNKVFDSAALSPSELISVYEKYPQYRQCFGYIQGDGDGAAEGMPKKKQKKVNK